MARTLDLLHLVHQSDSLRNADWEQAFFLALTSGHVQLDDPQPRNGPDGWPYLFVRTDPSAHEPVTKILNWLSTRGIGLCVNAHKDRPDYIFPYGMIWNWKERGQFLSPSSFVKTGFVELEAGERVLAGPPTQEYLPHYVRKILSQFLIDQGVDDPKVLLLSKDKKNFDLCFSLEALGSPPTHEHRGLAEALAWFLPSHYSIMLISEKGLPHFVSL